MAEERDRRSEPRFGGLIGELSAEFAGTMILILFGVGVVAQVVAGGALTSPPGGLGNHDSIAWAWGIGVTLGVYTAARLSGGHLNPAVTLALAAFKGFSWRKVLPYWIAQFLGAFVAALLVRWNYTEVLGHADPGHTIKTQFVFSTLPGNGNPAAGVHEWGAFRDQIIGTAILMLLIFALTDVLNNPPRANLAPWIIGLVVVAIGMAWGTDAGYAINPARDFGPRLASYATGYNTAWRDQWGNLYWWVPVVAPLLGGLVGAALYKLFVGNFLPRAEPEPPGRVPAPEEA
ncbi:MIP/aquaporin family protein [Actinacidiphila acididurans]|uniref:Aquaporin family protein n=1 Tax=Actinacidiphila acididurans TaxID=2784346 RepID=A0ABS2TWB7_9ACTN|nr:MIP/aquaporin family protein [Actinacidiphila acididurans]MBM9507634.1 aquaporin family protein [Actinacidiphila acididurans]